MCFTQPPLRPGDTIAKYVVERVLGAGGMAVVVAAKDTSTGAKVAIKCLLPEHAESHSQIERFRREADVTSRLQSKHVVRVLAFENPGRSGPHPPYMVMERLEGTDLASLLAAHGSIDPCEAADFVVQACDGLAEAHALGVVHRDIKPANLFLTQESDGKALIKVMDFGVAKLASPGDAGEPSYTDQGVLLGSPAYMSPEQLTGCADVDARTDIWSLGVTLYRLVTGTLPFGGATPIDLELSIARESPRRIPMLRADVPEPFDAVVHRCLQKQRNRRYPSATSLAASLKPFASASNRTDRHPLVPIMAMTRDEVTRVLPGDGRRLLDRGAGDLTGERSVLDVLADSCPR